MHHTNLGLLCLLQECIGMLQTQSMGFKVVHQAGTQRRSLIAPKPPTLMKWVVCTETGAFQHGAEHHLAQKPVTPKEEAGKELEVAVDVAAAPPQQRQHISNSPGGCSNPWGPAPTI